MVFSSSIFLLLFLPLVLGLHFLLPWTRIRNVLLLMASLVFYAWGEAFYVLILLASILLNWGCGYFLGSFQGARRRLLLAFGVAGNLGLLGFFKYANFVVENLNRVFGETSLANLLSEPVHLPLGISFFTFQAISYLVDIERGQAAAQRRLVNVALYISLFPQLIAGPIVRYAHIADQLARRTTTLVELGDGARRFVVGLAKKVLVANVVGEAADGVFRVASGDLTAPVAWWGLLCYTLQIYFDFSGYSDMAIGLGRMFGFDFPENFRHPYGAQSVREFWRRWHISLSTWFRDYVYIPLGGNRISELRTAFNLLLVFFLCGLWHGASWNFVIWGLFHGAFLGLERTRFGVLVRGMPALARHAYLLVVVMAGWVFFRAENLTLALQYFGALVDFSEGGTVLARLGAHTNARLVVTVLLGAVFSLPVQDLLKGFIDEITQMHGGPLRLGRDTVLVLLLVLSTMGVAAGTYNPFIYFRF